MWKEYQKENDIVIQKKKEEINQRQKWFEKEMHSRASIGGGASHMIRKRKSNESLKWHILSQKQSVENGQLKFRHRIFSLQKSNEAE